MDDAALAVAARATVDRREIKIGPVDADDAAVGGWSSPSQCPAARVASILFLLLLGS